MTKSTNRVVMKKQHFMNLLLHMEAGIHGNDETCKEVLTTISRLRKKVKKKDKYKTFGIDIPIKFKI